MASPRYFFSFFPQFTPDPLNDAAWGPGFTDWDLIRAMPDAAGASFRPAGAMYDTADPDYLKMLNEELKSLGDQPVGLMVYHYFFDGRHVLDGFERNLIAAAETPPFFLCWANETWSKRWIGKAGEIIIEQRHIADPAIIADHVARLLQLFAKPAYLHIDGRPVLMVYNPLASATLSASIELYRQAFAAAGVHPLIGTCLPHDVDPATVAAFDFLCEFQPRFFYTLATNSAVVRLAARAKTLAPALIERIGGLRDRYRAKASGRRYRYHDYLARLADGTIERRLRAICGEKPLMRATFLSWDNRPRYQDRNTMVVHDGVEGVDLAPIAAIRSDASFPILVNSWNEWSEGAALEPASEPHRLRRAFLDWILGSVKASGSGDVRSDRS
jgi:hypothetical protein